MRKTNLASFLVAAVSTLGTIACSDGSGSRTAATECTRPTSLAFSSLTDPASDSDKIKQAEAAGKAAGEEAKKAVPPAIHAPNESDTFKALADQEQEKKAQKAYDDAYKIAYDKKLAELNAAAPAPAPVQQNSNSSGSAPIPQAVTDCGKVEKKTETIEGAKGLAAADKNLANANNSAAAQKIAADKAKVDGELGAKVHAGSTDTTTIEQARAQAAPLDASKMYNSPLAAVPPASSSTGAAAAPGAADPCANLKDTCLTACRLNDPPGPTALVCH